MKNKRGKMRPVSHCAMPSWLDCSMTWFQMSDLMRSNNLAVAKNN